MSVKYFVKSLILYLSINFVNAVDWFWKFDNLNYSNPNTKTNCKNQILGFIFVVGENE